MEQMQNFVKGLQAQVWILLDASTGGTIRDSGKRTDREDESKWIQLCKYQSVEQVRNQE